MFVGCCCSFLCFENAILGLGGSDVGVWWGGLMCTGAWMGSWTLCVLVWQRGGKITSCWIVDGTVEVFLLGLAHKFFRAVGRRQGDAEGNSQKAVAIRQDSCCKTEDIDVE
jgi:hypothetical protein